MEKRGRSGYRSIFWPILLIGVGVLWLLVNLNVITGVNWRILWRFWPVILIAIGLDVIFSRRAPILGVVLGLGTVALLILILVFAPSLGLTTSTEITTEQFKVPIGVAESANVDLEVSVGPLTVDALSDSNQLLEAEITHIGDIRFTDHGQEKKDISLQQEKNLEFNILDWPDEELAWDISLSPDVPIFLELNSGVGETHLDLSGLQLTGLEVDLDVGGLDLKLPAMDEAYSVIVKGSVGNVLISIPSNASVNLDLDGDVGDFVIEIPEDAAVRLEADIDVGIIRLPDSLHQLSGDRDDFIGESGVWETSGFENASHKITITFNGGVGDLRIR
jgi:hypothetical protein